MNHRIHIGEKEFRILNSFVIIGLLAGLVMLQIGFQTMLHEVAYDCSYRREGFVYMLTIIGCGVAFTIIVTQVNLLMKCLEGSIIVNLAVTMIILGICLWDSVNGSCIQSMLEKNKWLVDSFAVVFFPTMIVQGLKILKKEFSVENNLLIALVILCWGIIGFVMIYELPIDYVIYLVLLNMVVVTAAIVGFNYKKIQNKNKVAVIAIYAMILFGLILLGYNKEIVPDFMSDNFRDSIWNPIYSCTYYGGVGLTTGYLIVLLSTMVILSFFMGGKLYRQDLKPHFLIYLASYMNLLFKSIFGVLYSFGLQCYEISPPFIGEDLDRIIVDVGCVGILLVSHFENNYIRKTLWNADNLAINSPQIYFKIPAQSEIPDIYFVEYLEDENDDYAWFGDYYQIYSEGTDKLKFKHLDFVVIEEKQYGLFSNTNVINETMVLEKFNQENNSLEKTTGQYLAVEDEELIAEIIAICQNQVVQNLREQINSVEDTFDELFE